MTFRAAEPTRKVISILGRHDEPGGTHSGPYEFFGVAFARSLILKTPPPLRATRKGRKRNPWNKTAQRKNDLLKKPAEAEQKHDLYSRLYKQYALDLLRLAICARALLTSSRVRDP